MSSISVIIPVYNGEKWLDRCFDSLCNQTIFSDLEIIFVDDGSTDRSGKIIDFYKSQYSNVSAYHISNHGVSFARNLGIEKSIGEYIAFLDADDWLGKNFFEELLNNMDEDCDIVCSGYIVEYQERTVINKTNSAKCLNNDEGIKAFLIGGELNPNIWSKLFRKKVLNDVKFDTSLVVGEDHHFLFRCLLKSYKTTIIPYAGYHYYMNETSISHSAFSEKKLKSRELYNYISKIVKENYPRYEDLAESRAVDADVSFVGELYQTGTVKQFQKEYDKAYKAVRNYSVCKKAKNSTAKHFVAFLLLRIHPLLYTIVKYKMKFQYR